MENKVRTTFKYKLYDGKELVYIGITERLTDREKEHKKMAKNLLELM